MSLSHNSLACNLNSNSVTAPNLQHMLAFSVSRLHELLLQHLNTLVMRRAWACAFGENIRSNLYNDGAEVAVDSVPVRVAVSYEIALTPTAQD